PHRPVIDRLEDTRALERAIGFARLYGAPAHRFSVGVCQDPGNRAARHQRAKRLTIVATSLLIPLRPWQPPPHTPAAGAGATRAEERLQIGPALRCERVKVKLWCLPGPLFCRLLRLRRRPCGLPHRYLHSLG